MAQKQTQGQQVERFNKRISGELEANRFDSAIVRVQTLPRDARPCNSQLPDQPWDAERAYESHEGPAQAHPASVPRLTATSIGTRQEKLR